jgi:hypothetical protein
MQRTVTLVTRRVKKYSTYCAKPKKQVNCEIAEVIMILKDAEDEVKRLLHRLIIIRDTNISQQDPNAPIITIASIARYLQSCQAHLNELEFQQLLSVAIKEAKLLPLRHETHTYFQGGVRRTVERKEFTQLMQMLEAHLEPIEPVSWSAALHFTATKVLPAVAVILAFSVIPVAAVVAALINNPHMDSVGSAVAGNATAMMNLQQAELQYLSLADPQKIDYNAIDYDDPEKFIESTAPIKSQFDPQKAVLVLNIHLVKFYKEEMTPEEREIFIENLFFNEELMQPLNTILLNSRDKELLHPLTVKLAAVFYEKILAPHIKNRDSLIISLGQALMLMPKEALVNDLFANEIKSMTTVLFLYQPYHGDKDAVREKISNLCGLPNMIRESCPILIYRVGTYDAPQKKIVQAYFSLLLEESMELFPVGDKQKPFIKPDQHLSSSQFMEIYPQFLKDIADSSTKCNCLI